MHTQQKGNHSEIILNPYFKQVSNTLQQLLLLELFPPLYFPLKATCKYCMQL